MAGMDTLLNFKNMQKEILGESSTAVTFYQDQLLKENA